MSDSRPIPSPELPTDVRGGCSSPSNCSVDDDVAKFKLPLPVKHLGKLHDLMVRMHGKGVLRMKQEGEWLVMFREVKQPSPPNDPSSATASTAGVERKGDS